MSVVLRPYQERAISELRAQYAAGRRAPCLVQPTGSGKTRCAAAMIRAAVDRGNEALFVAHRIELIDQTVEKLADAGITDVRMIRAGHDIGPADAPVTVASVQTLAAKRWLDRLPRARLVVIDECFPAGTLVDGRPIETIRVGDFVSSFNHELGKVEGRRVLRLFCSRPSTLVTVYLRNGRAITCTGNHPFFDGQRYVSALQLRPGDSLYGPAEPTAEPAAPRTAEPSRGCRPSITQQHRHHHALRDLRDDVHAARLAPRADAAVLGAVPASAPRSTSPRRGAAVCRVRLARRIVRSQRPHHGAPRPRLLLRDLQADVVRAPQLGDARRNEPAVCERQDARAESDAVRGLAHEGEPDAPREAASSVDPRRQRERAGADGGAAAGRAARGLDSESGGPDEAPARQRVPTALQDRSRAFAHDDGRRDRRCEPLDARAARAGHEEAGIAAIARVDRVEILERRGADGFGAVCPDDRVYNIEVDGNHNYFVDGDPADRSRRGILVHNCHHSRAPSWERFANAYRSSWILGLTATPQRADGRSLGDVFDSLVIGATVRELTALGNLAPLRSWSPPTLLESGKLALSPLEAYVRHAAGQRAVVFCSTVVQAAAIAAEMTAGGVPAEVFHGGLRPAARRHVLERFRAGELRALINVHALVEGWDDPGVSVCILARAPAHAGTFLQMVGRVLRPAPGKTHALLIDLCGSVLIHGTPEMDRTYSLEGRGIGKIDRAAIRQCPTCGGVFPVSSNPACPLCGVELPLRPRKAPRSTGVGVDEVTDLAARRASILRGNLSAAARSSGRCDAWIERAHAAISARALRWSA